MNECEACGTRLPYVTVLRACLFRRKVLVSCPGCARTLVNRTPLAGIQVLWIAAGAVLIFPGLHGEPWSVALAAAGTLGFWIATFWISAPWLCHFEVRPDDGARQPQKLQAR